MTTHSRSDGAPIDTPLEESLAQVDAMLDPGLEAAKHLRPPEAVAIRALLSFRRVAPAGFRDPDERRRRVDRLEGHHDLGVVATLGGFPGELDPLVLDELRHLHREGAGEIREVPGHRRALAQWPARAPGREVRRQLRGIHHRVEDPLNRPRDLPVHVELEWHGSTCMDPRLLCYSYIT